MNLWYDLPAAAAYALMGYAELTRRRSADRREECWHIYFDDVHVSTITERVERDPNE
jgi:hypothetical protein